MSAAGIAVIDYPERWRRAELMNTPSEILQDRVTLARNELIAMNKGIEPWGEMDPTTVESTRSVMQFEIREYHDELQRRKKIEASGGQKVPPGNGQLFDLVRSSVSAGMYLERVLKWPIKQTAKGYRAVCPIHGGDNPLSFSITLDGMRWHCFSCDRSGGAIELAMVIQQLSPKDAALHLAHEFGIELPVEPKSAAKPFSGYVIELADGTLVPMKTPIQRQRGMSSRYRS